MRLYFTLILLAVIFSNCHDDPIQVPTKDEFTKDKREALGKMLSNHILSDFEILPEAEPYDSLYWYAQTLYDQATSIMLLDKQSPVDNRWDPDRQWSVHVINNDEMKHAFTVPGGELFISTGMLKSFEREHELFYILTFEAAMMNEGWLLDRLIEEYNSLTINNLIEGLPTGNSVTISDVATDLPLLIYDEETVEMADKITVESICKTSLVEPTGINIVLLDPDFQNAEWLHTRPSYSNRPSKIIDFSNVGASHTCGKVTDKVNYQKFVLDVLN